MRTLIIALAAVAFTGLAAPAHADGASSEGMPDAIRHVNGRSQVQICRDAQRDGVLAWSVRECVRTMVGYTDRSTATVTIKTIDTRTEEQRNREAELEALAEAASVNPEDQAALTAVGPEGAKEDETSDKTPWGLIGGGAALLALGGILGAAMQRLFSPKPNRVVDYTGEVDDDPPLENRSQPAAAQVVQDNASQNNDDPKRDG